MIFPNVRISELKTDLSRKGQAFDESALAFKSTLLEHANPLSLLKKHPLFLVGGLGSVLAAAGGIFKKRGWLGKIVSLCGTLLMRNILPLVAINLFGGLGGAAKKNRR